MTSEPAVSASMAEFEALLSKHKLDFVVGENVTGIVVFATHYGEDILDGDHGMTLVEQTALTSRNITGGYIVNLLTGYISLQTEHHLFPMMPTAHLDKAQPMVRAFFKKHGLVYRESNLVECVKFNIAALRADCCEPEY